MKTCVHFHHWDTEIVFPGHKFRISPPFIVHSEQQNQSILREVMSSFLWMKRHRRCPSLRPYRRFNIHVNFTWQSLLSLFLRDWRVTEIKCKCSSFAVYLRSHHGPGKLNWSYEGVWWGSSVYCCPSGVSNTLKKTPAVLTLQPRLSLQQNGILNTMSVYKKKKKTPNTISWNWWLKVGEVRFVDIRRESWAVVFFVFFHCWRRKLSGELFFSFLYFTFFPPHSVSDRKFAHGM